MKKDRVVKASTVMALQKNAGQVVIMVRSGDVMEIADKTVADLTRDIDKYPEMICNELIRNILLKAKHGEYHMNYDIDRLYNLLPGWDKVEPSERNVIIRKIVIMMLDAGYMIEPCYLFGDVLWHLEISWSDDMRKKANRKACKIHRSERRRESIRKFFRGVADFIFIRCGLSSEYKNL